MTPSESKQHAQILTELANDIGGLDDSAAVFSRIAIAADKLIGHKLLTVLRLDPNTLEVERLFTTEPEAYPVGGTKPMRKTWWGDHVLVNAQPYIGYSADDIREHFADHEVILGLGLESILNVPVRLLGRTLGTINLLHRANYYDETRLQTARPLAAMAAGPLLLESLKDATR